MMSIRSIVRSAPRAASRLSVAARRTSPRALPIQQAFRPARIQTTAAFSTSSFRMKSNSEVDEELTAKLESELQMEQEIRDVDEVPTGVKDFLATGTWEVVDALGDEEVVLKRKYGSESIQIAFSIADINAFDPESDAMNGDRAYADEEGVAAEQQGKDEPLEDDLEEDDQEPSFPARLGIVIEKDGKGAIAVEAIAQEGMIVVDNVYYYDDPKLAYAKTPEAVHKRQDVYVGPPFGNLDEDLQVLLERYLDERGINNTLAAFVPEYIDMKEQKEYLRWLSKVKGFVEA